MKKPEYKTLFWIGSLCFLGAFINTMGFIKYTLPMSHVTGNFVKSITSAVAGKYSIFLFVVGIPLLFVTGTIISGILFKDRTSDFGKKYGKHLIFLGFFLIFSVTFFSSNEYFAYFLSLITGMQNGMYLNYKGSTCRTTHITGTITDFGMLVGNHLGGNRENSYKIHYYFINIICAFTGMTAGGIAYGLFKEQGLYIPSAGYLIIGTFFLLKSSARSSIVKLA